jgi:uncharacterized membrane protein YqhA
LIIYEQTCSTGNIPTYLQGEMTVHRILSGTRYLIVLPILGLALAASFFFIFGGYGLIKLLYELVIFILGFSNTGAEHFEKGIVIFEVILVGTVLYITAVGLYQLFIHEIQFPDWLKIDSTEELETNLIGVTVVVLAVNFMGAVFAGSKDNLLSYGAGIALPIAALGLFVGLRAWATKLSKAASTKQDGWREVSSQQEDEQLSDT